MHPTLQAIHNVLFYFELGGIGLLFVAALMAVWRGRKSTPVVIYDATASERAPN